MEYTENEVQEFMDNAFDNGIRYALKIVQDSKEPLLQQMLEDLTKPPTAEVKESLNILSDVENKLQTKLG